MHKFLNLDHFPIDSPPTEHYKHLVEQCRESLAVEGMFSLQGFVKRVVAEHSARDLVKDIKYRSFTHSRRHNIYFKKQVNNLPPEHPALLQSDTTNQTLCADQLGDNLVIRLYEWPPLRNFLADVMQLPALYLMDDPLARVNVMADSKDQALGWHFDRAEFTTTLLLQSSDEGGIFEYRLNLRDDNNPNYDGVAQLLSGEDQSVKQVTLLPGTLNVFRGKNTAHRVTPVGNGKDRVISVFSYFEQPGIMFSATEQQGFYGRTAQ